MTTRTKTAAEKTPRTPTTLRVSAKVSDLFWGCLEDEAGDRIGERSGYVPAILNDGDNDYISLDVDVATGKIVGWKRPEPVDFYKFRQVEGCKRVPRATETRTIRTCAKVSDLFWAALIDERGEVIGEYDGYVLPCMHDGDNDYVEITIEVDTGLIRGWKAPALSSFKAPRRAAA